MNRWQPQLPYQRPFEHRQILARVVYKMSDFILTAAISALAASRAHGTFLQPFCLKLQKFESCLQEARITALVLLDRGRSGTRVGIDPSSHFTARAWTRSARPVGAATGNGQALCSRPPDLHRLCLPGRLSQLRRHSALIDRSTSAHRQAAPARLCPQQFQ